MGAVKDYFDPGPMPIRLRILAVVIAAAIPATLTAGLWAVGNYRHGRDIEWCSYGHVDKACVAEREGHRWGPFLAFGRSANRSQD